MSAFPDLGNFKTHFLDFGFGLGEGLPGFLLESEFRVLNLVHLRFPDNLVLDWVGSKN